MVLLKLFVFYFLLFTLPVSAEINPDTTGYSFLPAFEYYDCAPHPLPEGYTNLVEGKQWQLVDKKAATTFIHGSQLYIVIDDSGEFAGLYTHVYGPEQNKDMAHPSKESIFMDAANLANTIFIESNEAKADSMVADYHLPVFSFQLCKDQPPTQNSLCLEVGYLYSIEYFSDVFIPVIKNFGAWVTFDKLFQTTNLMTNYQRILSEENQRWRTQRIYMNWDATENVETYVISELGDKISADIMLGILKVSDTLNLYEGTEKIHFASYDKEASSKEERAQQMRYLLDNSKCVQ